VNLATIIPHTGFEWSCLVIIASYLIGVCGTDIWLIHRMKQYIRDKYPDVAARLGASFRLIFFMRNTKPLGLHDPELDRMFYFKKRFDKFTAILFIVILVVLLLLHGKTR
jgi:hypothetical protein